MELRAGYKRSDLGIIPKSWEQVNIAREADMITVGFVGSMSHLFTKGGVLLLRGQDVEPNKLNISNTQFISRATHKLWSKSALKEGDVVITRVGASAGMACPIPGGIGEANAASLVIVRPTKTKLNPIFLSQLINSNFGKKQIESLLVGGAQPVINTATAANFQLALPGKREQDAIATALSDVDALLAKIDQLIAKKRDLKQAAMQQLLTGQTRLPGFSGEWEVRPFGEVLSRVNGKAFQIQSTDYQESGDHPVVDQGMELVIGFSDRADKLFRCPTGGVIVFGDHTCIVKFVDFDFVVGADGTQIMSAKNGQSARFHGYQLEFSSIPSTGYNRHFKFVKEREYLAPALAEQTAIATVLADMDAELAALEVRRDKTRTLKQGMMQELLTGRIRLVGDTQPQQ